MDHVKANSAFGLYWSLSSELYCAVCVTVKPTDKSLWNTVFRLIIVLVPQKPRKNAIEQQVNYQQHQCDKDYSGCVEQVDKDLAYLKEGTKNFEDYVFAVTWAQKFARVNRDIMMSSVLQAAHSCSNIPQFEVDPFSKAVNCHHNYVNLEMHFGKEVFLTRKGAVSNKILKFGII